MKIGIVQYNPIWEDKEKNKDKLNSIISKNKQKPEVMVFPEMTLTGFTMKAEKFAEEKKSASFKYFSDLAKKYSSHIFAGWIVKEQGKIFNSLFHILPDGNISAEYRKIHPFSYSKENIYFAGGEKTCTTQIDDWNIGLSICYDLRFPELYRFYAKENCHLIITIANWPDSRIEHWRVLLKARAIENQCYIIGVNRVGKDPKLNYNGCSSIFDPMGNEIFSNENEENMFCKSISLDNVFSVREKLPFLKDIKLI